MAEQITVHQALTKVMGDVQAVRKDSKNQAQKFNFRGIDAVMNAVGPALRKHGVTILPEDVEVHRSNGTTANGKQTAEVVIKVTYRIYGPSGDSIHGKVAAEAMDFGDKAVAKAMSDQLGLCGRDTVNVADTPNLEALVERLDAHPYRVMEVVCVRLSERVGYDDLIALDVPPESIGLPWSTDSPPILRQLGCGTPKHYRVPHWGGCHMHARMGPHGGDLVGDVCDVGRCSHEFLLFAP